MVRFLIIVVLLSASAVLQAAADDVITVGALSFDGGAAPADEGIMGARLAILDNNTTGRFTHQIFSLIEMKIAPDADPADAARRLQARGARFVISLLDAAGLDKAAASGVPLFNAAAPDERLRNEDCRPNVLHVLPDRDMLADGLAQYLIRKRWSKWLLLFGSGKADAAYAEAVRRAARRFGGHVVGERMWEFASDSKPENEIPVFTQGPDYDVVVVADEANAFGDLLSYRLWLPRPVVGTQGLVAKAWDAAAEDWGATQLQNRFLKLAKRPMTSIDYAAWLGVRAVGEAATRAKSADTEALRRALGAPDFSLAGFKGRQLSFRRWDGQLRQPIMLAAANGVISVSPQDGFMHPVTELDTLGVDKPETNCRMVPPP